MTILLCLVFVLDCMTITMEEGVYHYKATGNSEQVCGLYLLAEPDRSIIVTVDYLDVDCKRRGLISVSSSKIVCSYFLPTFSLLTHTPPHLKSAISFLFRKRVNSLVCSTTRG